MRRLLSIALVTTLALTQGCIAFVERGTRGGKVTPLGAANIQKGDTRSELIAKLGQPDDIAVVGTSSVAWTYRAVEGFYVVVYGRFDYSMIRVTLTDDVVSDVYAGQTGKDILVLTQFGGGLAEPSRNGQ